MPLDPQIQAMLAALASMNPPPMSQGTPEQARAGFRFMTVDMRQSRPETRWARARMTSEWFSCCAAAATDRGWFLIVVQIVHVRAACLAALHARGKGDI